MRVLVINPNTTPTVTDIVAGYVRRQAGDAVAVRAVTGRFGADYIASRAAAAIAAHAALDAFAEHGEGCDAVYLACFGDPGLLALKELAAVPVVGMAEAACREAAGRGRFAIVTGGAAWGPMLAEFVSAIGLADRLAMIRTVAPTGGDIARDPDGSLALLTEACRDCAAAGAEAVILGGAGLAGLAGRIGGDVPVPVICSVEAGTRAVVAALEAPPAPHPGPSRAASTGLSPALARLLRGS